MCVVFMSDGSSHSVLAFSTIMPLVIWMEVKRANVILKTVTTAGVEMVEIILPKTC